MRRKVVVEKREKNLSFPVNFYNMAIITRNNHVIIGIMLYNLFTLEI
jgi:hypothetical protein